MTTILRPNTVDEALDILARPMLVQMTARTPPLQPQPYARIMDVSRVGAMAGMQRVAGELIIGVNTPYADLIRSQLLWPTAACLVDACRLGEEETPGIAFIHTLTAPPPGDPVILALAVLHARAELAVREKEGEVKRVIMSLHRALADPPDWPHLLLNVRFAAGPAGATSALQRKTDLGALQPDVWAAAVWLMVDPGAGTIALARLAVDAGHAWPQVCQDPMADLIGLPPGREAVEAAVRLAQRMCPQPRASSPSYSLALSAHLIRETMDRAMARIHPLLNS